MPITDQQYIEAVNTIRRYEAQQDKTTQLQVTYEGTINACIRIPDHWELDQILEELKDGHYDFDKDDEDRIHLGKIVELVVNGEVVKV